MHSWQRPASELGFDRDNQWIAEAFWNGASAANWLRNQKGQPTIAITRESWSWPIWSNPNKTITVWQNPATMDEPARWSTIPEFVQGKGPTKIPFGSGWKVGKGSDGGILIDCGNGTVINALNLRQVGPLNALGLRVALTLRGRPDLAAKVNEYHYMADSLKFMTPENARTINGSGCGKVPKHAGLLTADMAANGVNQALSLVVVNTMMGNGAVFRGPATRVEHSNPKATRGSEAVVKKLPVGFNKRMLPCGARLVVDRPLNDWVRSKPKAQQQAARNVADGLAEFGMFVKETGNGVCQIESEGTLNPAAKERWASLGLKDSKDFTQLLAGLIRDERDLRVVREAV